MKACFKGTHSRDSWQKVDSLNAKMRMRNISQKDKTANDCKSKKSQSVEVFQIQKLATQSLRL